MTARVWPKVEKMMVHPAPEKGEGKSKWVEHLECGHLRDSQPGDVDVNVQGVRRRCVECEAAKRRLAEIEKSWRGISPKQTKLSAGNRGREAAKAGASRVHPDGYENVPHYVDAWYRGYDRQVERDAAISVSSEDLHPVDEAYPFRQANYYRGRVYDQGCERFRSKGVARSIAAGNYTHEVNERLSQPESDRSELFFTFDARTGDVVGGLAAPTLISRLGCSYYTGIIALRLDPDEISKEHDLFFRYKTDATRETEAARDRLSSECYGVILADRSGRVVGGFVSPGVIEAQANPGPTV